MLVIMRLKKGKRWGWFPTITAWQASNFYKTKYISKEPPIVRSSCIDENHATIISHDQVSYLSNNELINEIPQQFSNMKIQNTMNSETIFVASSLPS